MQLFPHPLPHLWQTKDSPAFKLDYLKNRLNQEQEGQIVDGIMLVKRTPKKKSSSLSKTTLDVTVYPQTFPLESLSANQGTEPMLKIEAQPPQVYFSI